MGKIVENGIIGYFDILGYQNFLKNNSIEDCIKIIEKIILEIPTEVKNDYLNPHEYQDDFLKTIREYFISHLNITFISDTIIFFFDFDTIEKDHISAFLCEILFYLMMFTQLSFEKGFPMRGYIDYGSFYYNNENNKNIIAGETIVKCYLETNNFDFSGLVISDVAYKFCLDFDYFYLNQFFTRKIIDKYLVNTKGSENYKYVLNTFFGIEKIDLVQFIFECFHKYNKEINDDVMKKINNTEKIMRHFIFNNQLEFNKKIGKGNT